MSDDASFDPRFAPEFQRGYPQADGARDASRTSPSAPGGSGGSSGPASPPASSRPSQTRMQTQAQTPAATPALGERRRARGGAGARELPGHRTEARSLIGLPPEEAERLSPYAAADRATTPASSAVSAPTSTPAPSSTSSWSSAPGADPVPPGATAASFSAPAPPASAGTSTTALGTPVQTALPATRAGGSHVDDGAPTSTRRRVSPWRNPWLYVLFAAGIALTITGVSLTRWSLFMMYSPLAGSQSAGDEPIDYAGVQVAWILGPTLVIVGGATIMGALFFVAASWLAARPLLVDAADDASHDADADVTDDDAWNGATGTFVPFDRSEPSAGFRDR
jgi:hypothetical protein